MKTFKMIRHEDVKTVSGTGLVAIGVDFGTFVALTWVTDARIEHADGTFTIERINTLTMFSTVSDVQKLHGHGKRTDVVLDQDLDAHTVFTIQAKLANFAFQYEKMQKSQKIAKVAA
jgi:hypothetical protein